MQGQPAITCATDAVSFLSYGTFEACDKLRHELAILIVDHHLDLALALSDRTVALERGAASNLKCRYQQ